MQSIKCTETPNRKLSLPIRGWKSVYLSEVETQFTYQRLKLSILIRGWNSVYLSVIETQYTYQRLKLSLLISDWNSVYLSELETQFTYQRLKLLHEISLIYNTRDISPSAKTCNLFGQYNEERKQWRMHDLSEGGGRFILKQKMQI